MLAGVKEGHDKWTLLPGGMVVKTVKTVSTEYRDELVVRGYQYSITSVSASRSCNPGIDCYD
ncbi:hypothetical protein DWS77_19660 [Escherichia coli]|nr:hypothetical protein CNQ47_23245 [Escherichia coli]AXV11035.1 hypothetical protein CHI19_05190 [Escherichia coli]EEZ0541438.1 hypothetical protein [Escherichia coli]EFN8826043.1 hypothetical protein [Escherichia coli]EFO0959987.1 hypothetical protein [Escherichia coli]